MRAFIAIEIPEDARNAVAAFGDRLHKRGLRASWVKPDRMHLTLRFLGDVAETPLSALRRTLGEAYRDANATTLSVRGVGAFPSLRRPAVIWAGVQRLAGDLAALQQASEAGARTIGLPPEHQTFHPHVTIARIRDRHAAAEAAALLAPCMEPNQEPEFGQEFKAAKVVLFSSVLTPRGPIYQAIQEYLLA